MLRASVVFLFLASSVTSQCLDGSAGIPSINGQCPQGQSQRNGFCCSSSAACVDQTNPVTGRSDCPGRANLCNNSAFFQLMTEQCPRTCGRCPPTCVDLVNPQTGRSDCPGRRNLCNQANFQNVMQTQCPRTCGFCR